MSSGRERLSLRWGLELNAEKHDGGALNLPLPLLCLR